VEEGEHVATDVKGWVSIVALPKQTRREKYRMACNAEAAQRKDFYGCIKIAVPAAEGAVALGECSVRMHLPSHELVDAGSCMNSRCRLEELGGRA
jgi:hypothetical protein